MPRLGSLARDPEAPLSLLVLTEGGQLVVHDLATWQPMPLTLPFQVPAWFCPWGVRVGVRAALAPSSSLHQ